MLHIERSYRDSLANAMWFFNNGQIKNILNGIMQFEDIHYVSAEIKNGDFFQLGKPVQDENSRRYEVDIRLSMPDKEMTVGYLSIESNLDGVVQRLSKKFWLILVSQALKTFFVSFFVLFIIYYLVTRHLGVIAAFAASLDIKQKNNFLKLDRSTHPQPDELDQITQAMNQMKQNLIDEAAAREQAEQRLRHAHKMEAIGQLTGGIAHDFNNILGIVMGNLELLQSRLEDNIPAQERIKKALTASRRAADLTAKLLHFARKEALKVSQVSVNDFIDNLEELISKSLTASIKVESHLSEDLWQVAVNPGELEDTLLNLSLNARDAMPEGGTLTIKTQNKVLDQTFTKAHPDCEEGEFVTLSISDTGTGMSDEVLENALEPFFTTKEQGKGTGLGLSMVYGFVLRSGGSIVIDSTLGQGTTFHIFLPRTHESSIFIDQPESQVTMRSTGSETILVVDDEEALREVACTYLKELGYNVLSAANAQQALDTLHNGVQIDLLLSDIIMPGKMDGYQLATTARQYSRALKIILTSGYNKQSTFDGTEDTFFIEQLSENILSKPYSQSELAAAVRNAFERSF